MSSLWLWLLSGCLTAASPIVLRDRQHQALERGDLLEAIRLGRSRVRAEPSSPGAHYDLACALARGGDSAEALNELSAAIDTGFDSSGFMANDGDLSSLRRRPEFEALLLRARQLEHDGLALPGLRTVVLDGLPTPLRVRLPPGGRPRLAIWLHPLGARLNVEIERLAPVLAEHGYALAVPLTMRVPGWEEEDLHRLFDASIPQLGELVDVEQPLLIGLSAGSHSALVLWARAPNRFRAVIATGCAPEVHGAVLPANGAPVFVINGARDGANRAWEPELARWQREGRRVSFELVPDLGHEFVLSPPLLTRLLTAIRL